MLRFLYEYKVKSTGKRDTFSVIAEDESEAIKKIAVKSADIEFTDVDDIEVGEMLKKIDASTHYYECEGCT